MNIINLDPSFKPFGEGIEFKKFEFPSGCEPHIKLPLIHEDVDSLKLTCRIHSGNDLLTLMLCVDAIHRQDITDIELFMPYLPFARQDRVMVGGEPLSVKVIAEILNDMMLRKVILFDVHSEVSLALIDNSFSLDNHDFVKECLRGERNYLIASPDAGAYKKIFSLCQSISYTKEIILCNKLRDVSTGALHSVTCSHDDLDGKDVFIVDDICDGGGTFIMLANMLRKKNCGNVNLIVSHGIFSKGTEIPEIDHIYTTDSFKDLISNDKITQIPLCSIL